MAKPLGKLATSTFANLAAEREDTKPNIEKMAAQVRGDAKLERKNLVLRITPVLQKALKRVAIDLDTTVEHMAIQALEKVVKTHGNKITK